MSCTVPYVTRMWRPYWNDTIEVSFAYAPPGSTFDPHHSFADYQDFYTSSSYPYKTQWRDYHRRHTVADVKLAAGQETDLPVSLQSGQI